MIVTLRGRAYVLIGAKRSMFVQNSKCSKGLLRQGQRIEAAKQIWKGESEERDFECGRAAVKEMRGHNHQDVERRKIRKSLEQPGRSLQSTRQLRSGSGVQDESRKQSRRGRRYVAVVVVDWGSAGGLWRML